MHTNDRPQSSSCVIRTLFRVISLGTLVLSLSFMVLGQSDGGQPTSKATLKGTVLDPNGSIVQNATVIVKDSNGRQINSATSDQHGGFSIDGLAPGSILLRRRRR